MICKRYIEKLNTWISDSSFDDVRQIPGFELKDREIYCITNNPVSDGLYIQGGSSHTVLGMEYNNFNYGSQLSFSFNGIKFRAKTKGVWEDWQVLNQKITTGVEFETGRIIDGKKEYGKRVDVGALPNNKTKAIDIGVNLANYNVTHWENTFKHTSKMVINFGACGIDLAQGYDTFIYANLRDNQIRFTTKHDASGWEGFAEIHYTKN